MRMILRLAVLVATMFAAANAQAACSLASATTTSFAASSSYDLRSGSIAPVASPTSLSCNGSILSLVTTNYARATATSANGFMLRSAAGGLIAYRLSADSAGAQAFTQGGTLDYFDSSLLSLLGILNGTTFVPTMYAAITDTPNLPAGTYTDTVSVAWSWRLCRGVGVGGVCILQETGSGTTTMTITVTVASDCRISAPALVFGSAPLASQFSQVTQAVAVDCTKDTAFNVAFTSGTSGASRPWRAMNDGSGHILQYNIFRSDGTTIWDQSNPLNNAGTGTGAITPGLLQTYVARVNPGQATPPPGNYTDTVSVVVTF